MDPVYNQLNAPVYNPPNALNTQNRDNVNLPPIPQRAPNARGRLSPAFTQQMNQLLTASLLRRNAPRRAFGHHTTDTAANPHLAIQQRQFAFVRAAVLPRTNNA